MNQPPELNSKDIRTISYIFAVAVVVIALMLLWASRTISAQEKPTEFSKGVVNLNAGTNVAAKKATGLTIHGCKDVTVFMSLKHERIAAAMWVDKEMRIMAPDPMHCDPRGRATFYVLPSQDYEIEVTKPEAR